MPMLELVQEMIFVNTCVKFCHNRLRNEVCRAVTPLGYVRTNVVRTVRTYARTYVRADPYVPCEGIIKKMKIKTIIILHFDI